MKKLLILLLTLCLSLFVFAACNTKVTITVEGENITINGESSNSLEIKKNETVTVEYHAPNGWAFDQWLYDDNSWASNDNPYVFTAKEDVSLKLESKTIKKTVIGLTFDDQVLGYTGTNRLPHIKLNVPATQTEQIDFPLLHSITYSAEKIEGTTKSSVPEMIDLGTYEVTATMTDTGNQAYETFKISANVTIVANELSGSFASESLTSTYTGEAYEPEVVNAPQGIIPSKEIKNEAGESVDEAVNAGTYTFKYTYSQDGFNDKTIETTVTIKKATSIISVSSTNLLKYANGEVQGITADNYDLNNDEQEITIVYTKDNETAIPKETGVYTATLSALESDNYLAPQTKYIYITIQTPIGGLLVEFNDATYNYDNEVKTLLLTGELDSAYTVAYRDNYGKNAGEYAASAFVTNTLTGASMELTAALKILKIDLTITAGDYFRVQGDALPEWDIDYIGLVPGDTLSGELSVSATTADGVEAKVTDRIPIEQYGNPNITYTIKLSGVSSNNYNIVFQDSTMTVGWPNTLVNTDYSDVHERIRPVGDNPVLGLQYDIANDYTTLNGEEWYYMGVNYFSLLSGSIGDDYDTTNQEAALEELASYNVRAIRFSLMPFYYTGYNSWWNYHGLYIQCLDKLVAKAEEVGIGLIPSFFWTTAVQDYYDEGTAIALRDENSQTRKFIEEFTRFIVNRYEDSPALFMWEYSNEANLGMDLPNWETLKSDLPAHTKRGEVRNAAEDKPTIATYEPFWTWWTGIIHEEDKHGRLIGSGDAAPRKSQFNQQSSSWDDDTLAQHELIVQKLNPAYMSSISWHVYGSVSAMLDEDPNDYVDNWAFPSSGGYELNTWEDHMNHMLYLGAKYDKSVYFGECGLGNPKDTDANQVVGAIGSPYTYENQLICLEELGEALINTKFTLALLWNYDPRADLLPDRMNERSTGTEWSWYVQDDNPKGINHLTVVKNINDRIDVLRGN